jgi:FkbM family methyltransferase
MFKTLTNFLWLVRKTWLTKSARTYYSQFGEDAVLREIISPKYNDGFFVDVGAYHPTKLSNTYALYKRGWRGINVDMDPIKIETFKLARAIDVNICAAVSNEKSLKDAFNFSKYGLGSTIDLTVAQATKAEPVSVRRVETSTLNEILMSSKFADKEIDLLSIDVEGHDYQVLTSLNIERYKPKIIIIESSVPNLKEFFKSPIYLYLEKYDYRLIGWTHLSFIFRVQNSAVFRI